jgi:hypothetical protein
MAFFDFSIGESIYRFSQLMGAPFQSPGILWFGLPLIATLIIIELNLRASSKGEHSIKQALPNALVLLFVSLDMARVAFSAEGSFFGRLLSGSFLASFLVFALAAGIFLLDYYRGFPEKKLLGFSAHLPINALAYACMVGVYTNMEFNLSTLFALVLLMALLGVLFFLVSRLEPGVTYGDYSSSSGSFKFDPFEKKHKHESSGNSSAKHHHKDASGDSDTIVDPFKGVKNMVKK